MKRRSSIKATSVLITLAMVMSLSGYAFADETEETISSEEQTIESEETEFNIEESEETAPDYEETSEIEPTDEFEETEPADETDETESSETSEEITEEIEVTEEEVLFDDETDPAEPLSEETDSDTEEVVEEQCDFEAEAAGGGVEINATNFPDSWFMNWIRNNCDSDNDGYLSEEELTSSESLTISGLGNSSYQVDFTGLQYFYFQELTLEYLYVDKLDLSGHSSIEKITFTNCHIYCVDLSGCTQLKQWVNTLNNYYMDAVIDLSNCPSLTQVGFSAGGSIDSINMSQCYGLTYLSSFCSVGYISIENVNLSGCVNLQQIEYDCFSSTDSVNLSGCTSLWTLEFRDGPNSLNLSGCISLYRLDCNFQISQTELSELNLSGCISLNEFLCYGAHNLTTLDISGCPNLVYAYENGQKIWGQYPGHTYTYMYDQYLLVIDDDIEVITSHADDIPVDEANFPDSVFRNYVSENCDTNDDGYLDSSELEAVASINVSGSGITSLVGLKYFTSLINLYCNDNSLTTLDVSNNHALQVLYCFDNQLTTLDVTNNPNLVEACYGSETGSSDFITYASPVSGFVLKVDRGINLSTDNNAITGIELNLSTLTLIAGLGSETLTATVLPENAFNQNVRWESSDRRVATVSGGTIIPLACGTTTITVTTIAGNFSATCEVNVLSDSSPLVVAIDETHFPDMAFRYCISKYDINGDGYFSEAEIQNVTSITLNPYPIVYPYYVIWEGSDNGVIWENGQPIYYPQNNHSIEGIQYFTSLKSLDCSKTQLTSLDLSNNTELEYLDCSNNHLSSLDVSYNNSLTLINCSNNQLTSLDVSNNTNLIVLSCTNNLLSTLKLGVNAHLKVLECHNNRLTGVDISSCPLVLNVYTNGFFKYDAGYNEYQIGSGAGAGDSSSREHNRILMSSELLSFDYGVSIINDHSYVAVTGITLNRTSLSLFVNGTAAALIATITPVSSTIKGITWSSSNPRIASVSGSGVVTPVSAGTATITATTIDGNYTAICVVNVIEEDEIEISRANFPDDIFRSFVSQYDSNDNGFFSEAEISRVTDMDIGGKGIRSLVGIDVFTSLTFLDCNRNLLTSLDVSGCTSLEYLNCCGNYLTGLDVSQNTELTSLFCYGNQLYNLNLGDDSSLEIVNCWDNCLTQLDLSGCPELRGVVCWYNQLTELDVSNCPKLSCIDCRNNQITVLNIVNNSNLIDLVHNGTRSETPGVVSYLDNGIEYDISGVGLLMDSSVELITDISVTGVTLDQTSLRLSVDGEAVSLIATVSPSNATNANVTWISTDTGVATVSSTGVVTPVAEGTTIVIAVTENGRFTATCIVTVESPVNPGWNQIDGKWYYYSEDLVMATGWQKISGKWYLFDDDGVMLTGWQSEGGKWYYFSSGGAMQTGWQKIGSSWYYFNGGGDMVTGWKKISNKWYYFSGSGSMQTGWQKISNKWYYFESSGAMKTGWLKDGGKWYYFESSGVMVTGTKTINGKSYNFNSSGVCLNP